MPGCPTVLNISPDHMDRYDSLEEYIAAKQRIFRGDGTRVVNADDPAVMAMVEPGWNVLRFTLDAPGAGDFGLRREGGDTWLACGSGTLDRRRIDKSAATTISPTPWRRWPWVMRSVGDGKECWRRCGNLPGWRIAPRFGHGTCRSALV
jgi:hypothetical protein